MKTSGEEILAYYLGESDEAESTRIRLAIENDPSLAAIAAKSRRIAAGFRRMRIDDNYDQALHLEEELQAEKRATRRKQSLYVVLVALTILLVAYSFFAYQYQRERVANEMFVIPDIRVFAAGEKGAEIYLEGLRTFSQQKDYHLAREYFESLIGDSVFETRARFYVAHSKFLVGEVVSARDDFNTLSRMNNSFEKNEISNINWNYWVAGFLLEEESLEAAPEHPLRDSLLAPTKTKLYQWFNQ